MNRISVLGLLACGLFVGCGGNTSPPTLDTAGEKEYERQQSEAAAAEGKWRPKVGKSARNPADE